MPSPANTYSYRDTILIIDETDYANQHWRGRLVPDVPTTTQRTAVPDGAIVDIDNPVWTFEITAAQINKTGGLAKLLRDAAPGTEMDVVMQPTGGAAETAGEPTATFTIKSMPVPFGGSVGGIADFEAVLPVVGQPVFGVSAA
jgi:hypothetical protein